MVLYEYFKVEDKQPVRSLGHAHTLHDAVEHAKEKVAIGEADEVWVTDAEHTDEVLAVVDKEGVAFG